MYESYSQGRPVNMSVRSIASGLAPPYAGNYDINCIYEGVSTRGIRTRIYTRCPLSLKIESSYS